jgi:hypothetical protein
MDTQQTVFRIRVLIQIRIQIRGPVPLIIDPDPVLISSMVNKVTRKKSFFSFFAYFLVVTVP